MAFTQNRTETEEKSSIVNEIRSTAAWVMQKAEHVRINDEKISDYAKFLLKKYPLISELDPAFHFSSETPELTAAYILALDSINFGSAYYADVQKEGIEIEYNVLASALKKAFQEGLYHQVTSWEKITADQCHELFGMPKGRIKSLDELMALFAGHLSETGKIISSNYEGKILNLLKAANGSALQLVDIVAQWKNFRDVYTYAGRTVPILKRAQILAADLNLAFNNKTEWQFADIGALTSFADNIVPHVLRYDDILIYTADLDRKINNEVVILSGSSEEIELRCAAIHTVEKIKQAALDLGSHVTSVNIDHLLWHRGHEPQIYQYPSHRTPGIFY